MTDLEEPVEQEALHVELYRRVDLLKHWSWRVVSNNNRVVSSAGEGFFSKWNAKRAAKRVNPGLEIKDAVDAR